MSESKLEYTLVNETKVNIMVSDIIERLAKIVDEKLEDYYLYQDKPYLSTDDGDEHVEVTLYGSEEYVQGSPMEWEPIFVRAIKRLAQDIADGLIEKGPEE